MKYLFVRYNAGRTGTDRVIFAGASWMLRLNQVSQFFVVLFVGEQLPTFRTICVWHG
jgi:hypothetical protein